MRRLLSITAFALFLTVPVWAQRGGGHAGGFGGARGGFGGARGFGGGHLSGGMHSGFSRGIPSTRGVHSSGFNGRHNGFHSRFGNQFSNCFGAFCGHPGFGNRFGNPLRNCVGALCGSRFGSPWRRSGWRWGWGGWGWGWGGYDPWLWSSWDYDDSRFDRDYYHDLAVAEDWNEENLAENTYRQQQADREQDAYARRSYSRQSTQPQPSDQQQQANVPPTVLIFRDQHQKEVTNYAIVGQTLWNFTPQRKEKIPLADLDIPATVKANDDRGVSFTVPVPHEGQ
jgi:hypothetical protein